MEAPRQPIKRYNTAMERENDRQKGVHCKPNLQIEIDSENDGGRSFSNKSADEGQASSSQQLQDCIKISDLVQSHLLQQNHQTLEV